MRFRDFLFEVLRGCYLVRHPTGKINSQLGKSSMFKFDAFIYNPKKCVFIFIFIKNAISIYNLPASYI